VLHRPPRSSTSWRRRGRAGEVFTKADTKAQRLLLELEITAVRVSLTTSRSRHLDADRVAID
jgi:hypothetical protein